MSARGSGDTASEKTAAFLKQNSGKRLPGENPRVYGTSFCRFRVPGRSELSPAKILKHVGDKVAAALHFVSGRRRRRRPAPNAAPSASGRSNPSIAPVDSHRAEAISDCIEFINSSSSLQRSNSVSANSC